MKKRKPEHSFADNAGSFMRIANGDVMTTLTRVCMIACTMLVSLLVWQAQQIIGHMKEQDQKLSDVVVHQMASDGSIQTMTAVMSENSRRIGRLEDVIWKVDSRHGN